jgi:solute carrier family 35 protein E3
MAERSTDRAPSVSSSHTEHDDHNEKNGSVAPSEDSFVKLTPPEELEMDDDVERAEGTGLLPQVDQEKPQPAPDTTKSSFIWMVVNTLATIGIVGPSYSLWLHQLTGLN